VPQDRPAAQPGSGVADREDGVPDSQRFSATFVLAQGNGRVDGRDRRSALDHRRDALDHEVPDAADVEYQKLPVSVDNNVDRAAQVSEGIDDEARIDAKARREDAVEKLAEDLLRGTTALTPGVRRPPLDRAHQALLSRASQRCGAGCSIRVDRTTRCEPPRRLALHRKSTQLAGQLRKFGALLSASPRLVSRPGTVPDGSPAPHPRALAAARSNDGRPSAGRSFRDHGTDSCELAGAVGPGGGCTPGGAASRVV
jgi:hypothetical protein